MFLTNKSQIGGRIQIWIKTIHFSAPQIRIPCEYFTVYNNDQGKLNEDDLKGPLIESSPYVGSQYLKLTAGCKYVMLLYPTPNT